jgi:acetylornithine deacetylase
MVAVDSVSSRPNRPMLELLVQQLDGLGGRIEFHACGPDKTNLLYYLGPDGPPRLALVGHSDTVPYDAQWAEALCLTEREGRAYGRGSADTKGGLAAIIEALHRVDPKGWQHPMVFVATADEEIGCLGAKRMLADGVVHPTHAVIAEPTSLVPIRGHKGYCADEVRVRGREAHSAYPHLGRSAILDAGRLLVGLESVADGLQADVDPSFDPPWTTLNVGTIQGGKARNVIAGECVFPVEWRPIPGQSLDLVHERLQACVERSGVQAELTEVRRDPGVLTALDAPIVQWLSEVTGHAAETVAFGTELPYLTGLGAESCVIGPGDIREAHRTGEFVPLDELEAAVEIYRRTILRFCQ